MLLLRDNSLRAWRSPVDILSFGLSNSILASSNFTSSRKVSRATDSRTGGSQFTWKEWGSFSSPWKIYCSRIRLTNWLKAARSWRRIRFSFVTGVGINFRPRDSRVICLSVSCSFDRFLTYCLRDSMALKKRLLYLIFLCFFLLWFLAALLSLWFAFPFPLLLRSLIRNKSKIHFVFHTLGLQFTLSSLLTVFFLAGDCVFWCDVCLVFLYYSLQYSCEI